MQAMGKKNVELVYYDPKKVDLGKLKAFPMRDQHFFASIDKAQAALDWTPQYNLHEGLLHSYKNVGWCASVSSRRQLCTLLLFRGLVG